MDIDKLNKTLKLAEQEELLTKEKVRDIVNTITYEDYELEEEDELVEKTFNTMYDEYKCYGLTYYDYLIIPAGDYDNYLKDVANEFGQALPDGLDDFFPCNELYVYLRDHNKDITNSYLESCVEFINKNKNEDYYVYKQIDSGEYEGIEYIIIKEELL
jgi:hypothetical protein